MATATASHTKMPPARGGRRFWQRALRGPQEKRSDETRRYLRGDVSPEVVHTPHGPALLATFVRRSRGARGDWTMRSLQRLGDRKERIRSAKAALICGLCVGGV